MKLIKNEKAISTIKSVINLLRIRQWYKGGVVVMGMVFGGKILDIFTGDFFTYIGVFLGFLVLGLISSINYIINDIMDIEKDKLHPEKSKRPLASGELSILSAILIIVCLIALIVSILWYLISKIIGQDWMFWFGAALISLFLNGLFYNLFLKNIVFIDIISLSLNYIFRTMAGCFIARVEFSPWLYIIVFEVALFLAINKRISDLEYLGSDAVDHKPIYSEYDSEILKNLTQMMATSLFITYTIYCIVDPVITESATIVTHNRGFILFSIPVALYLILRYLYLSKKFPEIARNPDKVIKDIPIVLAAIILVSMILLGNYIFIVIPD